jgi:hypothetical protein
MTVVSSRVVSRAESESNRTRFLLAAEPDKGTKRGGQLNDVRGSLGGVVGGRARTRFAYPESQLVCPPW